MDIQQFVENSIQNIKQTIGDKKAILALSGGVDSSVCAALVSQAVGSHLTCVFVDHGLMRKGERESVEDVFNNEFDVNLIVVDAKERFMAKLKNVEDPEEKRKIIGEEFIRVFEEEQSKLSDHDFLVQGTIAPDIEESGKEGGKLVKSHHNVGGLPEDVNFELVEPLRELYKAEVRAVGRELGLPEPMVARQPFPGPGLGVRCLGEITEERLEILKEADYILRDEVAKAGLEYDVWQYFVAIPDFKVVGKIDEERAFAYPIFIRGVISEDAKEATWYGFEEDFLRKLSKRITNELPQVVRVLYDITDKPPATIEYE